MACCTATELVMLTRQVIECNVSVLISMTLLTSVKSVRTAKQALRFVDLIHLLSERNAANACATKMTALKKTRDTVTTSIIVPLAFARPPEG